ncbi:MAG: hypothetical protein ACO3YY_02825 [Phycisphaerales bacterium]
MIATTLAYLPFLEPLPGVERIWMLMLLPLALGISVIYKAMKVADLERYWRSVGVMTVQIVLAMTGLAVLLAILVQVVVPMLPAEVRRRRRADALRRRAGPSSRPRRFACRRPSVEGPSHLCRGRGRSCPCAVSSRLPPDPSVPSAGSGGPSRA